MVVIGHANRRPFLKSEDYSASVWQSGEKVKTEVYKAAFMEDVYYLKMDVQDGERDSWIVFHPERKSVGLPVGLYHSILGYSYTHSDQGIGVDLTDGKLEDDWSVEYSDASIQVVNKTLGIDISIQPSSQAPQDGASRLR